MKAISSIVVCVIAIASVALLSPRVLSLTKLNTGTAAETFNARNAAGSSTNQPGPSLVSVKGRQLILRQRQPDGTLGVATSYLIKGVNWSPASRTTNTSTTDPNNANVRRAEFGLWASTDIPLMKAMNVNTVRLLIDPGADAAGRAVLDQLYSNGIMAIMTVDDAINNTTRAQQVVNFYKDHPAILMWMLGSEWNINRYFGVATSVSDAAQRTENAAALIKSLDANHPVATSYGEIDINADGLRLADTANYVNNVCPSVDVWALNIYRGNSFGSVFEQWKSISTKPMFIGEFGTDAFRTTNYPPLTCPVSGFVDQTAQANWVLSLWHHLSRNLAARHPMKAALGGTVFEWNDEWWKVQPPQSQENCGHDLNPGGHPDTVANEEYFGIVDIDRQPRQIYTTLQTAYNPYYRVPEELITFRASSRGANAEEHSFQFGAARFYRNNSLFYEKLGGGGGGRGFNVAAIHPGTGELIGPAQNFDTYSTRNTGAAMSAMISFLNSLPNGTLILFAVADEAGLTLDNSCTPRSSQWTEDGYQALEALGSTQIRNYCFRGSWAMATFKGEQLARAEQLANAAQASAETSLALPCLTSLGQRSDFDGDGKADFSVFRPANGTWNILNSIDGTTTIRQWGNSDDKPVPGDYTGDGRTDIAVFRRTEGNWYILNSDGNPAASVIGWGENGDKPVPGDYDGDGKTDVAVFRPPEGNWYIRKSSGGVQVQGWGTSSDKPVPGDYDGDCKTDMAVFRPEEGNWYILRSSGGGIIRNWGLSTAQPVASDFDGDHKTDVAVFHPSEGNWFIINSGTGLASVRNWGGGSDKSVPADYDGDERTDIAVWRPLEANWYVIESFNGLGSINYLGMQGDVPLPSAYLPE